jgi:hypothetical protein
MAAKLMVNAEELYDGTGSTVSLMFYMLFASLGAFVVCLYISPFLFLAFLGFMLITFTVLGIVMAMWIGGI